MTRTIHFVLILSAALGACVANDDVTDELADVDDPEVDPSKTDSASTSTYYQVSVDGQATKVARVNRTTTVCGDLVSRAACDVDSIDLSGLGFTAPQQTQLQTLIDGGSPVLMRGAIARRTTGPTVFVPTELWFGKHGEEVTGVFVMLQAVPDPLACMAPCEPIVERKLNSALFASITGVDMEPLGVTEFEGEQLVAEAFIERHALIVSGARYSFTEDGHRMEGRTATAAYKRVLPADFE